MRLLIVAIFALIASFSAQAHAQSPDPFPSAAFQAMEDGYDREIAAVVRDAPDDLPIAELMTHFRDAAAPIAARHFGQNWDAVRAETARRLALAAPIDLSIYASETKQYPLLGQIDEQIAAIISGSQQQRAATRFYDPQTIALNLTWAAFSILVREDEGRAFTTLSVSMQIAPWRLRRGQWGGGDALVMLAVERVVIIPYSIGPDGMIAPEVEAIAVVQRFGAPR